MGFLIDFQICQEINEVLVQVQRPDVYTKHKSLSDFHHICVQTIFSVLDYLSKWKRYTAQMKAAETPSAKGSKHSYTCMGKVFKINPEFRILRLTFHRRRL